MVALAQEPLNNESVIKMVRAGLSDDVILSMVRSQPAKYSLTSDQLIALKSAGVADKIVAAMVDRSAGGGQFQPGSASGATPAAGNVTTGDRTTPWPVTIPAFTFTHEIGTGNTN